jgi:NADP-dependent aldehyde dehydrogenase
MMTTVSGQEDVIAGASRAVDATRHSSLTARASWLGASADGLEAARSELIDIAGRETHLPGGRLDGELARTVFQLRLFAEVVREGSFLGARIDHADPSWGMGPRPDLRRVKRAVGPVLVFAASNFPFAFSVAGGDSASALAAGCPVIVKAHEGHPELSRRTADIVIDAVRAAGAPAGVFGLVEGRETGVDALRDPRIAAGGFTGSITGGRALYDVAVTRPVPIPFYAEMGSVNPVVITAAAVGARSHEVAEGLVGSMTQGVGQFCTKPGVVFVPAGSGFLDAVKQVPLPEVGQMLTERMADRFREGTAAIGARAGVRVLARGQEAFGPVVFVTDLDHADADRNALILECFGPSTLLVEYDELANVAEFVRGMEGQLTGTVVAERDEELGGLVEILAGRTGRVLWNQWPTGVSVTYAQQHGGPYPATSLDTSTSVGTAAIERWQRAVSYQNMPASLLPEALRDDNPWGVPQLVH